MKTRQDAKLIASRFGAWLEAVPDAMVVVNPAGRILAVNQHTLRLFKYEADDLIAQPIETLIPERLRAPHVALREQYAADPHRRPMGAGLDLAGLRRDGSEFPVEISLSPIDTDEGRVIIAAIRDATERRRIESKFRGLLEAAPDGMIVVDVEGRIRLVNTQTERLFDYHRTELLGQPVEMLIPRRFADVHPNHRERYTREPHSRPMGAGLALYGRRKDGTEFPVEISLSPLETEEGRLITSAIRDITDRKRLEENVRRQTEDLMEQNRAQLALVQALHHKDEFLATLAHELRNPLAPIRFALESLRADVPLAAAVRARDVIDRQVTQLVRLVDDLLDVSRITTNKIRLRREPVRLADLMEIAVESAAPLAGAADHRLDFELPSPSIWIDGDAARLVQVFSNVLNNAVKFTPRGGRISFAAKSGGRNVVVRVSDTGIGIAAEALPHLFNMFHQEGDILDRSTGGLGIGLTLARRLVEMHDGRIEVRSAGPGKGTEVDITLPTTTARSDVAQEAEAGRAGRRGATRPLRVQIVDDNVDAAEMLGHLVSGLGHTTKVAHDGPSALELAEAFRPDVVLLDIGLPLMNGYAVAQELRRRPALHDVYLAAVTGWGQTEDRRRAREAGFDTHFTKPVSAAAVQDLLSAVARGIVYAGHATGPPRTRFGDSPVVS
jgi:PAS domain S-box-containing protein